MFNFRSPPPAGSTVIEIESDECGTCEPVKGRKWDPPAKPSFVTKSDGEWQTFLSAMQARVQAYRKEGLGTALITPILLFSFVLFHPSFGVVAQRMEDNQMGAFVMGLIAISGVSLCLWWFWSSRTANMKNDEQIKQLLRDMSQGSGATFELATAWTGTCKPKGTRTYRAVWIYAGGAQAPGQPGMQMGPQPAAMGMMLVTVPVGSQAGDALNIQAPSGMLVQVVVPPGVLEGGQFQVALPAAPVPVAVAATPVAVQGTVVQGTVVG